MLLLVSVIALAWILVALAAVALCVYARRSDEQIAGGDLATVTDLPSSTA